MNNHLMITGKSGSGKTTKLLSLIDATPTLVIDPKGDLLQILKEFKGNLYIPGTPFAPNFLDAVTDISDKIEILNGITEIKFTTEEKTSLAWLLEQFKTFEGIPEHPVFKKGTRRKVETILRSSAYQNLKAGFPAKPDQLLSGLNLFIFQKVTLEETMSYVDSLLSCIYHTIAAMGSTEFTRLKILIDEAAFFCPPGQDPVCKKIIKLIASRGRSLGIHLTLATQAITEVDVKVANNMGAFLFGRSESVGDLRRVRELYKVPDLNLQRGEFWSAFNGNFEKIPSTSLPHFLTTTPLTLDNYLKTIPKPLYSHDKLELVSYPTETKEEFSKRVREASQRVLSLEYDIKKQSLIENIEHTTKEYDEVLKQIVKLREKEKNQLGSTAGSVVSSVFNLVRGRTPPVGSLTSATLKQATTRASIETKTEEARTLKRRIKELNETMEYLDTDLKGQIEDHVQMISG